MVHRRRIYNIAKIESVEELAKAVTESVWTLCTGFELGGHLFLNDSFTEDSAQEYAVVKDGRQVESITFGWCDRDRAAQHIRDILAGQQVDMGSASPRLNHGQDCPLCR